MRAKHITITTLLAVLASTVIGIKNIRTLNISTQAKSNGLPVVELAPALTRETPSINGISKPELWNLPPNPALSALPPLSELFKPLYIVNRSGRFEALTRSDRPNDTWELQGIFIKSGTFVAVFYNPAQPVKRLKLLEVGGRLDERLVVKQISSTTVLLEEMNTKKPQRLELKIFNSNRDSYVKSSKTR